MKFNIISEPSYSLAEIKLNDGESIVVEPGAMAWMDTTIKPKTEMKGGFFAGIKRKFPIIFNRATKIEIAAICFVFLAILSPGK